MKEFFSTKIQPESGNKKSEELLGALQDGEAEIIESQEQGSEAATKAEAFSSITDVVGVAEADPKTKKKLDELLEKQGNPKR